MSELPKAYEPQAVEEKWYAYWLKQNCFTADPHSSKPPYSIVIPPPNVTGMLHMGHVLNNTIQDILARKARMEGKEVLWLPGTDHAGIATQVQVEKQIWKEEKKRKDDIGRDEFLRRVWAWKERHGGIIIQQLKKLGCSCDWTRERFTMDPEYSKCVQRVFVDLYKKGLIYRGKRMVNWDPATLTALSDEEVEMESQKGSLYYFKVEVVDSDKPVFVGEPTGEVADRRPGERQVIPTGQWLTIATTRPETIPGDTAVAVNPKDSRYTNLIGKYVLRPLPAELPPARRLIPVIGDEYVDFEFGTGVLKVTPAHDKNDFDIGERHKLAAVDVMNPDATMNDLAGADLHGMDRFEARQKAVELLREMGALVKEEPYENKIGFSQRGKVPIEPRLSEQWFMKYPSLETSTKAVEGTRIKFYPERWTKTYLHWMHNIRDWCISRQLWWGHRVPVWTKRVNQKDLENLPQPLLGPVSEILDWKDEGTDVCVLGSSEVETFVRLDDYDSKTGEYTLYAATAEKAAAHQLEAWGFTQDPDVLDTWASSWLWPFATMGWPEQTDTLKRFYPTTDLVTGPDIIFFWVARMIMAGYEYMGDLPFHNVYFTGIIRDKLGRKMSKSLGNSPDPLVLIDKYGADALRFGTMRSAPLGQDVLFDEKDVELGRNFCNKLWNACRFRQMQGGEAQEEIQRTLLSPDDKWILLKLDLAIREINQAFAEYKFNEVTQTLYRFFWSEYCDWYVEASKAVLQGDHAAKKTNTLAVIDFVLSNALCLFHPFLPFITEELWYGMGYTVDMPSDQGGSTIMFAHWPKPLDDEFKGHYGLDDCYLEMVEAKYELVRQGRNLRREANIPASKKVKYVLKPGNYLAPQDGEVLRLLLNAEALDLDANYVPNKGTPSVQSELGELYLPLEGMIDVTAEKARLTKELEKTDVEIKKVVERLANPGFTQKVPPNVLAEHQKRLAEWETKKAQIIASLAALNGA